MIWKDKAGIIIKAKQPNDATIAKQISWEIEVKFLLSKAA